MGTCQEKYYNNTFKKSDLLVRIEELRNELHNIVAKAESSDSRIISKSQELDIILNKYYNMNKCK